MKKERMALRLSVIEPNTGQLEWLPKNPRQWTQSDIDRTAASIAEDEDFLEDRPLLVVPFGKKYVVFAGNLRREGAKKDALATVPAVIYTPETGADYETIKRRALKDNGSFGSWDFDELANNWDDLPLVDWGVPAWEQPKVNDAQQQMEGGGLSSADGEGDEEYEAFVDKFKKKLTADDCYTPPAVYDAVLKFVGKITDLKGKKVERPFFPGGDYEAYEYAANSIVIDNPPFSILSQILRFYTAKGIPFFLFAPQLTLFSAADCDLTYIISDSDVIYENGASIRTGFITNLIPDLRVWCCPELRDALIEAQQDEDKTKQGFVYPDNIVTSATLGKIVKRSVELKIRKKSCEYIKQSDSAEEQGRALYGGGFILSERAAAERAAATKLDISKREREIIERLNAQDID